LRVGSYLGPDSFRRFLKSVGWGVLKNSELNIDISKHIPKISDYGNIEIMSVGTKS